MISGRHPAATDGRSDRAHGVSPAGEREESEHSSPVSRNAPALSEVEGRANQVTENPETQRVSGSPLAVSENLRDWIPVPFDPNRNPPKTFTKSGKPLRKIRQKGLPVLGVKFPGPWSLLASRPAGEKWWR